MFSLVALVLLKVSIFVAVSWVERVFTDWMVLAVGRLSKRSDFSLLSKFAAYMIVSSMFISVGLGFGCFGVNLLKKSWFSVSIGSS